MLSQASKQKRVLKLQLAMKVHCSHTDSEREKLLAATPLFSVIPGRITEVERNHLEMWVFVIFLS